MMAETLREGSKAPRMHLQARFWRPILGFEQGTAFQRFLQEISGGLYKVPLKFDGFGCPIGFEKYLDREYFNLVTTGGKNDLLDKYFAGSGYTATWYLGLVSSVSFSAYAAGDTMSSHAGWTEAGATNAPNYGAANRSTITFAAASGGVKASSAITAFTFSNSGTVKGGFITTGQVKDATTGILYSAGNFTAGDAPVANGYVMTCTASLTQT